MIPCLAYIIRPIATALFLLSAMFLIYASANTPDKIDAGDVHIKPVQAITTTTTSDLHSKLQRFELTDELPADFKDLLNNTLLSEQVFAWYLHEGDLVIHGNVVADLPLLVRGSLVITGTLITKAYNQVPVLATREVFAHRITINDGWLYAGTNVFTRAVLLKVHDCAPSFIGTKGKVYTEFLNTYGDAAQPTKIVKEAIQLSSWGHYQNLNLLIPKFAHRLPKGAPTEEGQSDAWEAWEDDGGYDALLTDLLRTCLKSLYCENNSIIIMV